MAVRGDFRYYNPTKLYFGKDAIDNLASELGEYGDNVVLIYGRNSIKKSGLYDRVTEILRKAGKNVAEISGVMSNPTVIKLYEGMEIARAHNADLLLAVGGGSAIDYAKAVAGSTYCGEDPWQRFYLERKPVENRVIPVGCILTMAGTGSEMNDNGTITNHETKDKIGYPFGDDARPRFAIMNPEYTYSLPHYQMVSGIFDILSHIMEQYFSGPEDSTSDCIAEGLMRSLISSSRVALKDPTDYDARSNIMWTSTWALNGLINKGKQEDWEIHMMGQAIAAFTDATHGMTLSAVSLPYYRFMSRFAPEKFARFAAVVWAVDPAGKSAEETASQGLDRMEEWMKELGVAMKITEVGVSEDMIAEIADRTPLLGGGYHAFTRDEVEMIYRQSL